MQSIDSIINISNSIGFDKDMQFYIECNSIINYNTILGEWFLWN